MKIRNVNPIFLVDFLGELYGICNKAIMAPEEAIKSEIQQSTNFGEIPQNFTGQIRRPPADFVRRGGYSLVPAPDHIDKALAGAQPEDLLKLFFTPEKRAILLNREDFNMKDRVPFLHFFCNNGVY